MNQYEFEQCLTTITNNLFLLDVLVKTNIAKEMWNILPEENKRLVSIKVYENICVNLPKIFTDSISYSDLFKIVNKEDILKNAFNDLSLIESIKKEVINRLNVLILNIKQDEEYTNIIKNSIINKIKESYQNILSMHGDIILKEAKALIVRVSAEQSILHYGAKLMQKAKQLVDEEIIKDLVE